MKTYLVTGGAGFIGSNFIIYMLNKYKDIRIINLDKLTYAGNLQNVKSIENNNNYKFVLGDLCDIDILRNLFKDYDIDFVVNFAAESHVDRSIEEPDVFVKTNVLGALNLLTVAKENWQQNDKFKENKMFLQVSTDEVYGSLGDTGYFTEETPLDPHSPYSASKAAGDLLVKSYYDTYKMPVCITRCSNNYGPYQFPEKLIPLIINNCLNKNELPIYGDGLNIRDWLYVEDHCRAIDMVLQKGKSGQVYNIGGNNERTNIYIVKKIISLLKEEVSKEINENLIHYVEDRKGHDRRYGIDASKIKNEIGWEPSVNFEDGINKTITWYLSNDEWLEEIVNGEYKNYYKKMYNKKIFTKEN